MASKVNRQNISAEDFFFFLVVSSELVDSAFGLRRFFHLGLQPPRCTKQLIRVKTGRSFAWTCRLRAPWPAPSKIIRSPRRLFKASRSRSRERSSFRVSSTRGQPRGRVVMLRSFVLIGRAVPGANPSGEVGNRGARMRRGIDVPNDGFAHPSVALVPGVPPFGAAAPRRGRPSFAMVRALVVSPLAIDGSVPSALAGWLRLVQPRHRFVQTPAQVEHRGV